MTLTCSISVGKDESSSSLLFDLIYTIEDFEKQMHELYGVIRRANSIVDLRHVGDVAVVRLVEIDAVPAALELYLGPQTVGTARAIHVGSFGRADGVQARERGAVRYRSPEEGFAGNGSAVHECASRARIP